MCILLIDIHLLRGRIDELYLLIVTLSYCVLSSERTANVFSPVIFSG